MIDSIQHFIEYFGGVRKRTLTYACLIPADRLDWSPKAGEYTCAEIVRHIASAERMFVGVVTRDSWKYDGHEGVRSSLDEVLADLAHTHREAMGALRVCPDAVLDQPRRALEGDIPVKAWRWLMAMSEHEIHHRSQLTMGLFLLGITPPHIYGMGVEEVIARATG